MSGKIEEQLSAFLDDELTPGELELLLRQMDRNPEYQSIMARYSMAGDCVRGDMPNMAALNVNRRVHDAIREDRCHASSGPVSRHWPRIRQGLAGAGIAAAVAVVALLGLQAHRVDGPSPAAVVSTQTGSGAGTPPDEFSYIVTV